MIRGQKGVFVGKSNSAEIIGKREKRRAHNKKEKGGG